MIVWRSEPLRSDHDLASFDCGNDTLNEWLRVQAGRAQQAGTARTFVWVGPAGAAAVRAYYSISATQVTRDELSASQAGGYSVIPAFLLARLALCRDLHGQGLGSELLVDALETAVKAADAVAARLIVVDAIDDAAAEFYRRHDFTPVKNNPRRLVMKVASARNALALASIQVSSDEAIPLVSILFTLPDGRTLPVLLSRVEAGKIADRLSAEFSPADQAFPVQVDFSAILLEILGRDPFAEAG